MKRLVWLDYLKAFAIFLVVWGHAIQFLCKDTSFWNNATWNLIYSFHMPLFFLISGYLFFPSVERISCKSFFIKKAQSLLVPYFTWHLLIFGIALARHKFDTSLLFLLYTDIGGGLNWFLAKLFIIETICCLFRCLYLRNEKLSILCFISLFLLLPKEVDNLFPKYYLCSFLTGMVLYNKSDFIEKYGFIIFGIALLIFVFLSPYFRYDRVCKFQIINWSSLTLGSVKFNIIFMYNLFVSISGAYLFFYVFKVIFSEFSESFISNIGRETLGVYVLQNSFWRIVSVLPLDFSFLNFTSRTLVLYNYALCVVIGIFALGVCYFATKLLKKNKIIGFMFF